MGVVLQFLKDEGALEQMWDLSLYKKGSPTHISHSSFQFFSREKERGREEGASVSKGGRFQVLKTSISSKYLFSLLIFGS